LNNRDIKGAERILVTVATSRQKIMGVKEQQAITSHIMEAIGGKQPKGFKLGFIIDETLGDSMSITVLAAKFNKPTAEQAPEIVAVEQEEILDEVEQREIVEANQPLISTETETLQVAPEVVFTYREDDTLRLRKMIDNFCQKMPSEIDLEAPAFQRYGIKLMDVSDIKGVDFQTHTL
jgi:cell division protein FtsZ